MRHMTTALVLVLSASLAGASIAAAQRTERRMIVSVIDDDGAPATGLTAADFEIREDDAAREVLRVGPAGADRQIAILVDTSQAASRVTTDLRRGLETFVDGMREGNQIALITFGGPPRIVVETTSSLERLREGIGRVFPQASQAAYMLDAMGEVAEGFTRRGAARPIMVVVTMEALDYSNRWGEQVLDLIRESGAAVYMLSVEARRNRGGFGFGALDNQQQQIERDIVLARGPEESGGFHRDVLASSAVEEALSDIVTELRNQYLVVYSSPDSLIPPEEVEVGVTRTELTARGTLLRGEDARP